MKLSLTLACLLTLFSCQLTPKYKKTVNYIDLHEFMGTWYVQTGRFTPFETDVYNSIERYTWNAEKKIIEIDFTYRKGAPDGELIDMPQTAHVYNEETNAHWKVSPFWPLQFDFLIIAVGKDQQWTAIGVPNRQYLWIMTREQNIAQGELKSIIEKVSKTGYPVDSLTNVVHSAP
jgi:apolipoprotein D and lipocalin family protein